MNDQSVAGENAGGSLNLGRLILSVLRSSPRNETGLCILDVRHCGGHENTNEKYPEDNPFVQGMKLLQFEQVAPGFFSRPARCNETMLEKISTMVIDSK
jgi:hypothetical protein